MSSSSCYYRGGVVASKPQSALFSEEQQLFNLCMNKRNVCAEGSSNVQIVQEIMPRLDYFITLKRISANLTLAHFGDNNMNSDKRCVMKKEDFLRPFIPFSHLSLSLPLEKWIEKGRQN